MFASRELNEKIGRVHEKYLTSVLNDHQSTLDGLLDLTYSKKRQLTNNY